MFRQPVQSHVLQQLPYIFRQRRAVYRQPHRPFLKFHAFFYPVEYFVQRYRLFIEAYAGTYKLQLVYRSTPVPQLLLHILKATSR